MTATNMCSNFGGFRCSPASSGSDVAEQLCAEPPSSDNECNLDDSETNDSEIYGLTEPEDERAVRVMIHKMRKKTLVQAM